MISMPKKAYRKTEVIVSDEKPITLIIPDQLVVVETKISNALLKNIGDYIAEGLNEEEACLLANFDYSIFQDMKKRDPKLNDYIRKQLIKLKQKHLKIIQASSSDKNSQWILEKVFPDEYGPQKKKGDEDPIDALAKIIKQIQHDPNTSIIREATATDTRDPFESLTAIVSVTEALG